MAIALCLMLLSPSPQGPTAGHPLARAAFAEQGEAQAEATTQGIVEILLPTGDPAEAGRPPEAANPAEFDDQAAMEAPAYPDESGNPLSIGPGIKSEFEPEIEPETVPVAEPEAVPEVEPETVPEVEPETVLEAEPETMPEAEPETVPEIGPIADPEANPEGEPDVNLGAEPEITPEIVPESESGSDPEIQSEIAAPPSPEDPEPTEQMMEQEGEAAPESEQLQGEESEGEDMPAQGAEGPLDAEDPLDDESDALDVEVVEQLEGDEEDPEGGEEIGEDAAPDSGSVSLGSDLVLFTEPGAPFTIAIPVRYARGGRAYDTNASADGGPIAPGGGGFDQAPATELDQLIVAIDASQSENFPLDPSVLSQSRAVISNGENRGYATFDDVRVLDGAEPGDYPLMLTVSWQEAGGDSWHAQSLTANIHVSEDAQRMARSIEPVDGDVELGACPPFNASPGDAAITLAIPLSFRLPSAEGGVVLVETDPVDLIYDTNPFDGNVIPYAVGSNPSAYDQSLCNVLSDLSITIAADQAPNFPLGPSALTQRRALIADGVNLGYAVFEDIPLATTALGAYPLNLLITWRTANGDEQSKVLTAHVHVTLGDEMRYGENGVIVFTHTQLKSVLQDKQYNPVYLGYCDKDMPAGSWETRNNGEIIYPTVATSAAIAVRRNVTIIGTDPRNKRRMKMIDRPRIAFFYDPDMSGIYLASAASITLRDVTVTGYNSSGIISSHAAGASASFINVHYTGCRAFATIYENNTVSISGCTINIVDMGDTLARRGQEVARVGGTGGTVHLYGTNTLVRESSYVVIYDHAIFWFPVNGTLLVHEGANVTVNTNNYLLREVSSSTVVVDGVMNLTTGGDSGCMTYDHETMERCTINGTLNIVHNSSKVASIKATNLVVNGTLRVDRQASSEPCIAIRDHNHAYFQSPRLVDLYNPGSGGVIRAILGTSLTATITTQAMNLWHGSTRYVWNNNDLSSYTVNASFYASNPTLSSVTGLFNNRGVAIGAQQMSSSNFALPKASWLVFGQYAASIDQDTVHFGSSAISGTAPAGSSQVVEEYERQGDVLGKRIQSVSAMGSTRYRTRDDWAPISAKDGRIYLLTKNGDLEAHIYADCVDACYLDFVSPTIDFGSLAVSAQPRLVGRQSDDWRALVVDTRLVGDWMLYASAAPLTSLDGQHTLPGALAFVRPDESWLPLSENDAVPIAHRDASAAPGNMDITWAEGEGIHLFLPPLAGEPGASYSTTIKWTLDIS